MKIQRKNARFWSGRRATATRCQAASAAPQTALPGLLALEPWLSHYQESQIQMATGAGQEMQRSEAVQVGTRELETTVLL